MGILQPVFDSVRCVGLVSQLTESCEFQSFQSGSEFAWWSLRRPHHLIYEWVSSVGCENVCMQFHENPAVDVFQSSRRG